MAKPPLLKLQIRLGLLIICSGAFLIVGCKRHASKGQDDSSDTGPAIKLNGTVDKWVGKTPVWDNGPAPADQAPDDIHITKVFFDNDSRYFYAFIQCSPTVQDRYKVTHYSGAVGNLFFDPDNDPNTGSPSLTKDKNPNFRGYKIKAFLSIGMYASVGTLGSGGGAFVAYDLFRFTGKRLDDNAGFNQEIPNSSQSSRDRGSMIVEGKDGVELAIPLQLLGLKSRATARIMIERNEGFAGFQQRVGFVIYHCH